MSIGLGLSSTCVVPVPPTRPGSVRPRAPPGSEEVVHVENAHQVVDVVVVDGVAAVARLSYRPGDVGSMHRDRRPTTSTRGVMTSLTVVSRRSASAARMCCSCTSEPPSSLCCPSVGWDP